jgi:uncharacterized protein YlxP (DUF503 family)
MIIGVVTATLALPEARSLKDKRAVLRSLKDRAVNRMNVSVAEVGLQDVWKSAELAFVTVAAESAVVQKRISEISNFLHSDPRYALVDLHTEML